MKPFSFVLKLSVLSLFIFAGSKAAFANTPEYIEIEGPQRPRLEFTMSAGLALQTGYLTTQDSVGSYILGVNFPLPGGLMAFDWQGFRADHNTGEFALTNNKEVRVSTFSFVPYIRVFEKEAWNLYLGLGFMEVSLSQDNPENFVNYGSFVFSGMLRYQINPKWSAHYKTQWFSINQTVNDQKTSFEVWNHVVGVGYSFY